MKITFASTCFLFYCGYVTATIDYMQVPIGNQSNMVWIDSIKSVLSISNIQKCSSNPFPKSCGLCSQGLFQVISSDQSLCIQGIVPTSGSVLDQTCTKSIILTSAQSCPKYYTTNTEFSCSHHFSSHAIQHDKKLVKYCKIGYQGQCKEGATRIANQVVYWIIDQSGLYYLDEVSIVNRQNATDMLFYDCDGDCSKSTNGDTTFCSHHSCSPLSTCYCSFKADRFNLAVLTMNGEAPIWCYGKIKADVFLPTTTAGEAELGEFCSQCVATCKPNKISIRMYSNAFSHVRACKSGVCRFTDEKSDEATIELPFETFLTHTNVQIDIWSKNSKKNKRIIIPCEPIDICSAISCSVCVIKLLNYHCLNTPDMIIWSLILSGVCVVVVILMMICRTVIIIVEWLLFPIVSLFKIIKWTLNKLTTSVKKDIATTKYHYKKLDGKDGEQELDLVDDVPNEEYLEELKKPVGYRRLPPVSRRPKTPSYMNCLLLIFFTLIVSSFCCSEFTTLTASTKQCYLTKNTTACRFKTVMDLDLSPVSQESCIDLSSNLKEKLGHLKIKTKSLDYVCDKTVAYYTFNPTVVCQSIHQCRESGVCNGQTCESLSPKQKFNDILSADINLGESGCFRSCGGWTCGCFHFDDGCLFYRKDLRNENKEVYTVYKCSSWVLRTILEVSLIGQDGVSILNPKNVTLTANNIVRYDDILIHIKSSSPPIIDTNWCLLDKEGKYAITRCSSRDQFSHGIVGEVQCMSRYDASNSKSSCRTDFSLIQVVQELKSISCRSLYTNVDDLFKKNSLPMFENNYHYIMDGKDLVLEEQNIARLTLQLSFDQLDLSAVYQESKVYIESAEITGCVNCNSGAMLKISARADLDKTVTHISCECFNTVLSFSRINAMMTTIIKLSDHRSSYKCIISTSSGSFKYTIPAHLINLISLSSSDSVRASVLKSSLPGEFGILNWLTTLSMPTGSVLNVIYNFTTYFMIFTSILFIFLWVLKLSVKLVARLLMKVRGI
ncbi:hypothetical protein [Aphis citricidus bunyavirus]|uniref:Glycoprotein n=1 Tax=Aphis citricidus bunyavirus TaxID=2599343 RepID=A0A5B8HAI7_9VIRU|nr:hypothetical protein QK833_sMgp1 [Aphis citricidus bunyavirus]QDW80894.1 hypothetical protein [Aphis citricidus bunyavirus]